MKIKILPEDQINRKPDDWIICLPYPGDWIICLPYPGIIGRYIAGHIRCGWSTIM